MEEYKNIKITIQATPKGEGSLVHWTMEYEQLNKSFPKPNSLLQFILDLNKDFDAHCKERKFPTYHKLTHHTTKSTKYDQL